MVSTEKVNNFITALRNNFVQVKDVVSSWTSVTSDDKIPSEKLVKDSLDQKVDKTSIFKNGVFEVNNVKNNGTATKLWNEADGGGALIIDGTTNVRAYTGVNEGSDGSDLYAQIYAIDNDTKIGTRINVNQNGAYYTTNKSTYRFTADDEIATKGDLSSAITNDTISIEKQQVAESGYAATYVLKQGGVALSPKINIPKDQMLRSASVEIVSAEPTDEEEAANLTIGDSYISLIVNTADNAGETELIIPIDELFDLQEADEATLTLSNGTYSIKVGGVDTLQLADNAVTTAKVADEAITEDKLSSELANSLLTQSDVSETVDDYLDAIVLGLDA